MINFKLATVLTNLAEIYKLKPADKNIVISMNLAARTLRDYEGDLIEDYSSGKLKNLPGISQEAYKLIKEYLDSGKIKRYEEIKSIYSEEMIQIIRMSGLGQRRMFEIYKILNVRNVEQLKDKLFDEDICRDILNNNEIDRDIINELYIKRLYKTIKYYEETKELIPRGYVENLLENIKSKLIMMPEIREIKFVGSIRRKKSFIRDIDILILPCFNVSAFDLGKSSNFIKSLNVLDFMQGIKSRDIRSNNMSAKFETIFGVDIELIITSYRDWGIDLLYTTGSSNHIKRLESAAKGKSLFRNGRMRIDNLYKDDLSMPEYSSNGPSNSSRDFDIYEDSIYKLLDLQYIPPELREDTGEVELAKRFCLPELVMLEDIKGDLHIHSHWSDGIIKIEEVVEKAKKYGYEYIAFSDHSQSNVYGNGMDERRALEKIKYIEKLNSRIKEVNILMGAEVDIKGVRKLDYSDDILQKMDIVIGSMHSNFASSGEKNTRKVISALINRYVDIIAHPTGVVFQNRAPYSIDIDSVIKSAGENNKALEINSYFLRLDLNEESARKAKKNGVRLAINTDSHRINNMDMIKYGVNIARRAGLEKKDVLNTFTLKELMEWKKTR
ncbi:MAG: PHP domain-containing protein [Actinobacteria bacterium]|nr:PHP domain-containing protein [Actinomycetota bacterium]